MRLDLPGAILGPFGGSELLEVLLLALLEGCLLGVEALFSGPGSGELVRHAAPLLVVLEGLRRLDHPVVELFAKCRETQTISASAPRLQGPSAASASLSARGLRDRGQGPGVGGQIDKLKDFRGFC